MSSDRLEDICTRAIEQPEGLARERYLDAACGDDAALRAEVEALLRDHERLGGSRASAAAAAGETHDHDVTVTLQPGSSSAFREIAETLAHLPHVLLRDAGTDGPASATEPNARAAIDAPGPAHKTGRYELFGEIARGGMGAVLKARDPDLNRELAVKVLLESHRNKPELVRRFVEEAQIGGQLQHPGIVPIYDVGCLDDRRPFFAMKLVRGQTLAQLLSANRVSAAPADLHRFLSLFEAVCQTMAFAHARGVIHRDLKPSNIMVGRFGEVQVMDWGLAKVLPRDAVPGTADIDRPVSPEEAIATARSGSDSDHSHAGSIMGTPAYMAPEQARGEIATIDERADVFALGSILCEILTGQPAFVAGGSRSILKRAADGDTGEALERLAQCGVDAELESLARDCLAIAVADRPREAGVVAARVSG